MARKLRVQYPGAIYHVMNRGDRREAIFTSDKDQLLFLETLTEASDKTDWQVHAWCLMKNHFHLVIETPRGIWWRGCSGCLAFIPTGSITGKGSLVICSAAATKPCTWMEVATAT